MEMEATGAPQNHHHTLNQQVGSITDRFDISIPINILLDVKTPAQLMETLLPWLENK